MSIHNHHITYSINVAPHDLHYCVIKHCLMVILREVWLSYGNSKEYNLNGQILTLLSRNHQFKSHKSQGHWKFTWLLTSGP
jgi:hypothetical protein